MNKPAGLIGTWLLDGKGGARPLDKEETARWEPQQGVLWVQLDLTQTSGRKWLREQSGLDAIAAAALAADETRPRCARHRDGLLAVLRGVNLNPGAEPSDMIAVRMWIDGHRIITAQRRHLQSVDRVAQSLKDGGGPQNTAGFLVDLAGHLADRAGEYVEELDDAVDAAEAELSGPVVHALRPKVAELRREAIQVRRHLAPQRDAMTRLYTEDTDLLGDWERMRLREVGDRVTRLVEDLDSARDRAGVVHEELASLLAEQLNQRMYVLAIVAGLFLPLGFVTGLLGINVGGIPGSDSPLGFAVVGGLLVLMAFLQLALFKFRNWF